jgi:hypothetical protein
MRKILFLLSIVFSITCFSQKRNPANKAVYLEDISWTVSQPLLTPDAVVVIPLGAGAKEHGPHLPLSTGRWFGKTGCLAAKSYHHSRC